MSKIRSIPHIGKITVFGKCAVLFLLMNLFPPIKDGYLTGAWVLLTLVTDALILTNIKKITSLSDESVLSAVKMKLSQLERYIVVTASLRSFRTLIVSATVILIFSELSISTFIKLNLIALMIDLAIRFALKLKHPFPIIEFKGSPIRASDDSNPLIIGSSAWLAAQSTNKLLDPWQDPNPYRAGSAAWHIKKMSDRE